MISEESRDTGVSDAEKLARNKLYLLYLLHYIIII